MIKIIFGGGRELLREQKITRDISFGKLLAPIFSCILTSFIDKYHETPCQIIIVYQATFNIFSYLICLSSPHDDENCKNKTVKWPNPEPDHYLVKLDHHPNKGRHLFRTFRKKLGICLWNMPWNCDKTHTPFMGVISSINEII